MAKCTIGTTFLGKLAKIREVFRDSDFEIRSIEPRPRKLWANSVKVDFQDFCRMFFYSFNHYRCKYYPFGFFILVQFFNFPRQTFYSFEIQTIHWRMVQIHNRNPYQRLKVRGHMKDGNKICPKPSMSVSRTLTNELKHFPNRTWFGNPDRRKTRFISNCIAKLNSRFINLYSYSIHQFKRVKVY